MMCVVEIKFEIKDLEQEFRIPILGMKAKRRILFVENRLDKGKELHLVAE